MIMESRKEEYMFTLVRQWQGSGLTRKEFSGQHGISLAKFGYWIARWKENQSGGHSGFIPIDPRGIANASPVSVVYPNGVRLEVPSAEIGLLSKLISLA